MSVMCNIHSSTLILLSPHSTFYLILFPSPSLSSSHIYLISLYFLTGEVSSFEVCPSRVRITRRLSYSELDEVLAREETAGRIVESLLTDPTPGMTPAVGASGNSVSGSMMQNGGDTRVSRGNLGQLCVLFMIFCIVSRGCS